MRIADDKTSTSCIESGNEIGGKIIVNKFDFDDFKKLQRKLDSRQEEDLRREFKSNVDYEMFPEMIEQKANALDAETEDIKIKITRLEAMIAKVDSNIGSHEEYFGNNFTSESISMKNPQVLLQERDMVDKGATTAETIDIDCNNHLLYINNDDGVIGNTKEVAATNDNLMTRGHNK